MTTYISADLRRLVVDRAAGRCEYCQISESDTFLGCQIDHIIAEKHGGKTNESNLAYTCTFCNRFKGTDIGSIACQLVNLFDSLTLVLINGRNTFNMTNSKSFQ